MHPFLLDKNFGIGQSLLLNIIYIYIYIYNLILGLPKLMLGKIIRHHQPAMKKKVTMAGMKIMMCFAGGGSTAAGETRWKSVVQHHVRPGQCW